MIDVSKRIESYHYIKEKSVMMHKYLMECLGTFFIALVLCLTGNPIAIGLMFMAFTCIGGLISGAHFNGAVSFAFFLHKKLSLHHLVGYMVAQTIGASIAMILFYLITDMPYAPEPMVELPLLVSMGMEAKLTAVLCLVVLAMASHRIQSYTPAVRGFANGLTLVGICSVGGLFNPSIALAALIWGAVKGGTFVTMNNFLIYGVGSLIGGGLAALIHIYFCSNESKYEHR